MRKAKVNIDSESLHTSSEVLRALAHPLRMRIMEFIDQHDQVNVNKIYNTLKLEQSITSQHLRILRDTGLVNTTRDGKYIYYSINYSKVSHVVDSIGDFLEDK